MRNLGAHLLETARLAARRLVARIQYGAPDSHARFSGEATTPTHRSPPGCWKQPSSPVS